MSRRSAAYDVVILGAGAAGLTLALELAGRAKVAVIAKRELKEGSSYYAQGGIAAVLDTTDTVDSHIEDTLDSGAGLCDPRTVRFVVENAKESIQKLIDYGVDFTRTDGGDDFHLTREGGHTHRRVIHAADATGKAVMDTLEQQARGKGIDFYEHHIAVDLIREKLGEGRLGRCIGVYVFDIARGLVDLFSAKTVVLATGGASRVYLYATNPNGSTGDGIAMAWRAGCRVANMEFAQFHPTCLYHPQSRSFLISEALRGEGGKLVLPNGERFMDRYDRRGELAPRDITARAIDAEMKRIGAECLYLDMSHLDAEFVRGHFPTIYKHCMGLGIDITKKPIPIVPAAHFTCGGVLSDLSGRTDVAGLYAIGEVACTGLHGANRIASNSLLECLVFGRAAARDLIDNLPVMPPPPASAPWDDSYVVDSDEEIVVAHNWDELRRFMWDYVGIVCSNKRLERAKHRIDMLLAEIAEYYGTFRVSNDLLELRNLALVADLTVRSAMGRKESRGLHYTLDFPDTDPVAPAQNTILVPPHFSARRQP